MVGKYGWFWYGRGVELKSGVIMEKVKGKIWGE